jgi:hypothetical protein
VSVRIIWGTVYSIVATATLLGTLLVAASIPARSIPLAISGLVTFLMGIASLRVSLDARWLKNAREKLDADRERLTDDRVQLAAERVVFTADAERTRRELEAIERRQIETLAAERAAMLAEIEAERDRLHTELAEQRALIQREAFEKGWTMRGTGVAKDDPTHAKVIALPVQAATETTLGSGALRN